MLLSWSVLFLSASVLAFEIIMIRLLAISHWQPFVTLAISTALLGYGLSGTVLMRTGPRAFSAIRVVYPGLALLASLLYRPAAFLGGALRLDPGLIIRDPGQWLKVALLVCVLACPFVVASGALALPLLDRQTVGRYYGWNLLGAALGVAAALGAMAALDTDVLPRLPAALAGIAAIMSLGHFRRTGGVATVTVLAVLFGSLYPSSPLRYGPYKDISYALLLPGARVEQEVTGLTGKFQVVSAPALRSASGLSTRFSGTLPPQMGLYRDGDRSGTLLHAAGRHDDRLEFMKWQTAAAPYTLLGPGVTVAVAGFDGGEEAVRALVMGAASVTIVEPDGKLAWMVRDRPDLFGRWIFGSGLVSFATDSVRGHLNRNRSPCALIVYPPGTNLASAAAGLTGTAENYEITVEGIQAALSILSDGGLVSILGWNQHPPTGRLKILNLLAEIPSICQGGRFDDRVQVITGWSTHTILAGREPLDPDSLRALMAFCDSRGFGLADGDSARSSLLPGIGKTPPTLFSRLDLGAPTDGRPYPWHSLKTSSLGLLAGKEKEGLLPRVEWGYFFLLMVLAVSILISAPALLASRPGRGAAAGFPFTFYFALLGCGYMALEILFIKRCLLVSGPAPVVSGIVLVSFLLGSGLGSQAAPRWAANTRLFPAVFLLILLLATSTYLFLPFLLSTGPWQRALILVPAILPTAFLMGMPFPSALALRFRNREAAVSWAWALTGYTSVVGSSLSGVLSVTRGLPSLLFLGGGCYLLAGVMYRRMEGGRQD